MVTMCSQNALDMLSSLALAGRPAQQPDVFSCSQRLYLQPTATLPSTRLHGATRGLRARSAVGAEAGAFPTTIGDSVRVQSPQRAL